MGWSISSFAQNVTELRDTLPASRLSAQRNGALETGTRLINPSNLRTMVAATGEGDIIKYVQTLPGVSTGGEGSSAFYVRGGNIGSNLITLDGVPLYGSSHLLGFTSVYSPESISEALFQIGGFTSEEGNLTSSHIKLSSATPDFNSFHWNASASNFLLGGCVSAPLVKDKVAAIASFRISPIAGEYAILKGLLPSDNIKISNASALVYDLFAKTVWKVNSNHVLNLSAFHSQDAYRYLYGDNSDEQMQWNNLVINLSHMSHTGSWSFRNSISYNRFSSRQGAIKTMGETYNDLAISSGIGEAVAQTLAVWSLNKYVEFQSGIKSRFARFSPGSSSRITGGLLAGHDFAELGEKYYNSTNTLHTQASYMHSEHLEARAAGRINLYLNKQQNNRGWQHRFDPELSLLARWYPVSWMGLEGTADWLTQYYHTLEGVPMGWSLDMIIPSDTKYTPETSRQYYAGVLFILDNHRLTIGGYDKKMNSLIYFKDASKLFSSALTTWKSNIDIGEGHSNGIEVLYEKVGKFLNLRLAYTYSKTDRVFKNVNNGKPFPAKFDRRHILNLSTDCSLLKKDQFKWGITSFFTFQSGHWETVAAGSFYGYLLIDNKKIDVDWFTTTNNYCMPNYIRWDLGTFFEWNKPTHTSSLNLGVYNILNRHNPFTVTFDPETRSWKQISLLPIMPSLNYRISF